MPVVQIIAVKKIFAVGLETADMALDEMEKRLKTGETARWLDARNLNLAPGEVRLI